MAYISNMIFHTKQIDSILNNWKKFEEKQLAILNSYNKEFKGNAEETQEREDKINEIREKRIDLYKECLKFLKTRVELDLALFKDDIWSH